MRLQVFLSRSGACSRRKALAYIKAGRVSVNGNKTLEPSFGVRIASDTVTLDARPITVPQKVYILLNKPKGVVTTVRDRFAKKTVLDLLPASFKHLHPVGRLDRESSGLLILTNDGALTYRLTHPSFGVQKTYRVFLDRALRDEDTRRLEKGILLEGKKTAPCTIRNISTDGYEIVMHEGRKRQIRRMFASLNYHVKELSRIKQGTLSLGNLKEGEWRLLTEEEVAQICSL